MKIRAALCLALACAGCAPHSAVPAPPPSNAQWHMTLAVAPAAPRQLDPTQLNVQIADNRGGAVSGAAVTITLQMPAMDMGQNQVPARACAAGVYAAAGRFTMPGHWQAIVQANKGALHQMQSFPVTVQ